MASGHVVTDALVYLHGGPGSPGELDLFGKLSLRPDYAPDRFAMFGDCDAATAFDQLAGEIDVLFSGQELHLIGFSMGGYAALELAHRLGPRVSRLDLIAAAAPLEGGAFLGKMAGRALFSIAQKRPSWLNLIMAAQSALVRVAPGLAYKMFYANAVGADRTLAADPDFKARIIRILAHSYGAGAQGLARELAAYVRPWAQILPRIAAPATIWHGSEDNWAPYAMGDFLVATLPDATLKRIEGASHYSALRVALAEITHSPS
jgi:pimeloyl-ACP methyl ester carboxylesterase